MVGCRCGRKCRPATWSRRSDHAIDTAPGMEMLDEFLSTFEPRFGFTLIELLVVIAIIAVLIALFSRRAGGPRSCPANAVHE